MKLWELITTDCILITTMFIPHRLEIRGHDEEYRMTLSREEVARIFPEMVEHFLPEKADGIDAGVQFELSGDNGGQYWLKIANKTATTGEGTIENPKMTIKGTADDYAAMAQGSLNPMQAFMSGRIKILGDMGLAMKFMSLFDQG